MLETSSDSSLINSPTRKSERQLKKRVLSFEEGNPTLSMDIKTENGAPDRESYDGEDGSQIPSPGSSSPYNSPHDGSPQDLSPIRENSGRNLLSFTECEVEDFLVEALLTIKSSVLIPDQRMQVELLDGKSPRANQNTKTTSQPQDITYEYVSQTCEEHKKKHLRCPINCKGRILVKVARAIPQNQHSISDGEESFMDSMDMENSDNESRFSFSKKRSQSSLSDDLEPATSSLYLSEQDLDEYLPYKSKKRQSCNLKKNIKKTPKKSNLAGDEEGPRSKGKLSRSMSAENLEKPNSSDSLESKDLNDDKMKNIEPRPEVPQIEEAINRLSKKQKTQSDEELDDLMDIHCRVSSASVTTSSTAADNANKSKRWIRFACEEHRKKHVKCPENCPNRKTEFVFGSAVNGADI